MLTTATRNEIISLARSGKSMAFVLFVRSNIRCGHGRTKVLDINILVRTNSASKNIAKMINEDYEITFGVELELVFGFREGLLRTYLKSIQDSSQIVKGISEGDRVTMASHLNSGGYTDRPRYMGWGLTGQTQHPLVGWNSEHSIRTYGDEPMQIARAIFPICCMISVFTLTATSRVVTVAGILLMIVVSQELTKPPSWPSYAPV